MNFGLSMFTTDESATPAEVARAVEDAGFESFWVSEHSNMPLSTEFPLPGPIPRDYSSMLDPFVALSAAATVTSRIKLGTAICLLTQRDPINCAKLVASIDHLSGGRMLLGIGAGWNEPEMRNHGTDPATRFRLMRERVEAMKELWTNDEAEYHGRHVDFEPTWQWPKPVQKPHPPVIIAGGGANLMKRVLSYGDGWIPSVVPVAPPEMKGRVTSMADLAETVPELNRLAAEAGRPRPTVTITGMGLDGAAYETFTTLGIDRMILRLTPAPLDDVLAQIDAFAEQVKTLGGTLE
ncbi:MAG: LLM class F420-dependent oxidoreductase [Gammaproteobacteria bacterium]|nr:LLM class F420-dependent oxidoreductase [Gammaproteobacteria bacterium]